MKTPEAARLSALRLTCCSASGDLLYNRTEVYDTSDKNHQMEGPAGGISLPQSVEQHIRLACQACQRKKIKYRSSLQCNPSHRKPRARHVGKKAVDSELRSRITKLESLVGSLSSEVGAQEVKPDEYNESPTDDANPTSPSDVTEYKYIANPFWLSLASEVQALRDALNDDEADEGEDSSPATQQSAVSGGQNENEQFDLLVCPPGSVFVLPGALQEPPSFMQSAFYAIFFENVAPFQRFYHSPTLRAFLEHGAPYLGQPANAPTSRLTKAAIWYAAVNTFTEDECMVRFGAARGELSSQYKKCVEVLLTQVDLMCTTEIAALQALLTYMVPFPPPY
nr:bikaverin cluster transcription factor bik5 [Quercus suber]